MKTNEKKKKKNRKKKSVKQRYQHSLVVITANNLLATFEQEAVIHPVPRIRMMSAEAIPVLRDIISNLRASELTKCDTLNMIAQIPTSTRGGAAVLPHLRTYITACNLDTITEVRAVDDVIDLLTAQQQDMTYEDEIAKLETCWALRAALSCREAGLQNINQNELLAVSRQGVMATYQG